MDVIHVELERAWPLFLVVPIAFDFYFGQTGDAVRADLVARNLHRWCHSLIRQRMLAVLERLVSAANACGGASAVISGYASGSAAFSQETPEFAHHEVISYPLPAHRCPAGLS